MNEALRVRMGGNVYGGRPPYKRAEDRGSFYQTAKNSIDRCKKKAEILA